MTVQPRQQIEHFATGQIGVNSHLAGQVPDVQPRPQSVALAIVSQDGCASAVGPQQGQQNAGSRVFDAAVQGEESEDLPLLDAQAQVVDGENIPVPLGQSANGN